MLQYASRNVNIVLAFIIWFYNFLCPKKQTCSYHHSIYHHSLILGFCCSNTLICSLILRYSGCFDSKYLHTFSSSNPSCHITFSLVPICKTPLLVISLTYYTMISEYSNSPYPPKKDATDWLIYPQYNTHGSPIICLAISQIWIFNNIFPRFSHLCYNYYTNSWWRYLVELKCSGASALYS